MNIFVTGANGYIGKALVQAGMKPLRCDVTNVNDVERAICRANPSIVIHLASKSNPDWCEKHNDEASLVNFHGTHNVMETCVKHDIPAVLLSSSQIWGGGWWEHLWNKHSEDSKLTPAVNSYGMQKAAAEQAVIVSNMNGRDCSKTIRTSYVFDRERFARELNWLKHGIGIDAPRFLHRSFVHLNDFVFLVSEYCKRFEAMPPVLHLAGSKTVSYYTFWSEVAEKFGFNRKLIRGRWVERDYMHDARRPHYGGLDISLSKELGFPSFDYVAGIERMKDENTTPSNN